MLFGFGNIKEFNALTEQVGNIADEALLEDVEKDRISNLTEDVVVPKLEDDKFVSSKKVKEMAAGNSPVKEGETKEPQLGCVGTYPKMEAFSENEPIDEESMKTAKENVNAHDKVANYLDDVFTKKFNPKKKPKYDLDSSGPKSIVSNEPIRKIPAGW